MKMKKMFIFLACMLFMSAFSVYAQPKLSITSYCDATLESCKVQDAAVALLVKNNPYDIEADYIYYFDISNPQSSLAHIALECANRQAMKAEYKAEVQNNLDILTLTALKQYAENAGLNSMNFTFCLDTQMTAWDVLEQVKEAEEDGITTAPSVRFNTDIYKGSQTYTSLKALAEEYLGKVAESPVEQIEEPQPEEQAEETGEIQEKCLDGGVDPETGIAYKCGIEEALQEESEYGQELGQIEEPLFFRAIRQIKTWMLSLFQ